MLAYAMMEIFLALKDECLICMEACSWNQFFNGVFVVGNVCKIKNIHNIYGKVPPNMNIIIIIGHCV